jgi:hypothetical protein
VPPASGGLDAAQGLTFGPDGNLYVASSNWFMSNGYQYPGDFPPGAVLKFAGPAGANPGAFLGTFIPGGSGGLANPEAVLFGPGGDVYVSSSADHNAGQDGILMAKNGTSVVLRYDATTGAFLDTFVTPDSGGLRCPISMTFTETDPVTLNYDGATTSAALARTTTQPAAAIPMTITARSLLSGPPPGISGFDPTALSAALPLSQLPAAPAAAASPALSFSPAAVFLPSLTGNLPPAGPAGSSQLSSAAKAASDGVFANLDDGLSLAGLVDDPAFPGGSSDALITAKPQG